MHNKSLTGKAVRAYAMSQESSVNIDSIYDLLIAEHYLNNRH